MKRKAKSKKLKRKDLRLAKMAELDTVAKKNKLKRKPTVAGKLNMASRRCGLRFTRRDISYTLGGTLVGSHVYGPIYWFRCDKSFGVLTYTGAFAVPVNGKGKRLY